MSDPIADAYVLWATTQKRVQPVQPLQEIRVTHDCVMAMTMTWQQCGGRMAYSACARAAWPHLFHAWVDGLTKKDRARYLSVYNNFQSVYNNFQGDDLEARRAALRALGPADPRREGV